MGVLTQDEYLVKWLFLSNSIGKSLSPYLDLMAQLIIKGRSHLQPLNGLDPSHIIFTSNKNKNKLLFSKSS